MVLQAFLGPLNAFKTFKLPPPCSLPIGDIGKKCERNTSIHHFKKVKMWHIYTVEYYSAIKRNKMELFVVRWMELESVIQSEVSQKEKNKYSMLTHIYGI